MVMNQVDYKSCSDIELITFISNKENAAFVEIMSRYKERCINFLYRYVGDYDDAYDLSQEVFVKLYLHASRYNSDHKFSSWLFAIAANLARDFLKKNSKRTITSLENFEDAGDYTLEELIDTSDAPDVKYDKNYVSLRVQSALKSLQPHYREVLILKEIQQYSFEEVAEILAIEIGTVKSRVFRGRALLKEKLKDLIIDLDN
jgi:RNA polymerase sigma-70 factor (ECF subfamily)